MKKLQYKSFYIEATMYDGEHTFPICQAKTESAAIFVAEKIDQGGGFIGTDLQGRSVKMKVRVIADDHDGAVDVIWENK